MFRGFFQGFKRGGYSSPLLKWSMLSTLGMGLSLSYLHRDSLYGMSHEMTAATDKVEDKLEWSRHKETVLGNSKYGDLVVFSGRANVPLAEKIVDHLNIELGKVDLHSFADGETSVHFQESVRGKDVFVIQSTSTPVNENLIELLFMISTLKKASAHRVTAIIPYYGYAR